MDNEKNKELIRLLKFYQGQHPYDTKREEIDLLKMVLINLLEEKIKG